MSNRKYPYIYGRQKMRADHTKPCAVCKKPATYICDVQYSWFRGDDEREHRCDDHSKNEES